MISPQGLPEGWSRGTGKTGTEARKDTEMTPGEALQILNSAMPEEVRGEEVDKAFDVLYDLAERALNESEAL